MLTNQDNRFYLGSSNEGSIRPSTEGVKRFSGFDQWCLLVRLMAARPMPATNMSVIVPGSGRGKDVGEIVTDFLMFRPVH